jgi:hypothetical protein
MILAHPHVLNTAWQEQRPPLTCQKRVPGHNHPATLQHDEAKDARSEAGAGTKTHLLEQNAGSSSEPLHLTVASETPQTGPCLFKVWELIPREAAQTVIEASEEEAGEQHAAAGAFPLCLRQIGSTIYQYRPTGESADSLAPGLFAALPITGFALIRDNDGSVNERARDKILAGMETHERHALPFYETDQ